jgi:hypothetical protein
MMRWWWKRAKGLPQARMADPEFRRAVEARRKVDQATRRAQDDGRRLDELKDPIAEAFRHAMRGRSA